MFNIYIKNFNRNGTLITDTVLLQTIPATSQSNLKLISPIVKNEMGNSEGFDFSIESGTEFYDAFLQMKTYIHVTYDNDTIFYGRVIVVDNGGFRGTRKVRCEGPLSFLLDSQVEPVDEIKRPEITIREYMQALLNNHNSRVNDPNKTFYIGEVPGNYSNAVSAAQRIREDKRKYGSDSWTDTKSALEDLRSHYGGFLRVRPNAHGNSGMYIDWMNHYFNANVISQTIEVGKNVLDISNATELNNIFTVVIPIGRKIVSNKKEDGVSNSGKEDASLYIDGYRTDIHGSGKGIAVPNILSVFTAAQLNEGYHKLEYYRDAVTNYGIIEKTVQFNDSNTKEKLFNEVCEWIRNNYQGEVAKFTIKAVDMHQIGQNTSKIMVGDQVNIIYPVGDENGNFTKKTIKLTCLSVSFDLYHPENNTYTFGIPANILTKTYGTKKNANANNTNPVKRSADSGWSEPKGASWINLVADWLKRHATYYHGPKPYKDEYGDMDDNPGDYTGFQLYHPDSFVSENDWLVKAWYDRFTYDDDGVPVLNPKKPYAVQKGYEWEDIRWHVEAKASYQHFNVETIAKYKVVEWVMHEYQYDLRTMLGVRMPTVVEDEDGNITVYQLTQDEETGVDEYVKAMYYDPNTHVTEFLAPDSEVERIRTILDADGNYHYWYMNSEGKLVETNIRDLSITTIKSDKRVGWIVTENEDGEMEFANPGEMTLSIENFMDGELVVSRVAGELTYLGNKRTQYLTATSLNHMDQICGDFEYETDPVTGIKYVKINSGGGFRVRHGRIKPDGTYERDPETGAIVMGEFGLFDDNTLKGGMIVSKLNDDEYVTKIHGSKVDITTNDNFAQLVIDKNGILQRVGTVESTVDSHNSALQTITGSALWTQRSQVVGVSGQFEVTTDQQGTSTLKILSGGGIKIKKNNQEFGLYDQDNLTAGVMVDKINDGTGIGNKKILGTRVSIKADQVVVGSDSSVQAWMDTTGQDLDTLEGLVAAKITAYDADIANIKADYVKASSLTATWLKGKIGDVDNIQVNGISAKVSDAECRLDSYYGNHYYFNISGGGGSVTYRDIKDGIYGISLTQSGNTYTLKKTNYAGTEATVGTFSRATTLSGAYSSGGNKVTVNASPQGNSYDVLFGAAYSSSRTTLEVILNSGTGITKSSTANAIDIPLQVNALNGGSTAPTTIYTVTRTGAIGGLLETKSVTSNGTYTPSTGKIGFSSVTVNVPSSPSVDSIDIPNNYIYVSTYQPTGVDNPTVLTKLPNEIKNNKNTYIWFRVDAKDGSGNILKSKWYRCASA